MNNIIGYSDSLWKVINSFEYTGESEQLILPAGEYLLVCHGAQGGTTLHVNGNTINYGGSAYGVINLTQDTTLFITVGGNGGNAIDDTTPGAGGFNGGGSGGHSLNNAYDTGAGGGGASDIRIGTNDLYHRVIVAGGGGGSSNISTYMNYTGNGGGLVGGLVNGYNESTDIYATQETGYSFGIGMDAPDKTGTTMLTSGSEGASGGGGGWYGGYANVLTETTYTSSNGGGGSGYVLTETSYKPEGYLLGEEYYLTNTFLNGGSAIQPSIFICQKINTLTAGDIITFPCVGKTEHIKLHMGKYKLKCYGGDGGCRTDATTCPHGGYAEGVLTLTDVVDAYITVGGSGVGTSILSPTYNVPNRPTAMFNGGGAPGSMTDIGGCAGGGGSDIRLLENTLYHRVIVAGGAGGCSINSGGNGGGLSGGIGVGTYGTSAGPGTQTSSPQNSTYPTINGGFGYGGNGYNKSTTLSDGSGGAGGGGWYGGSGTYPDSGADDDKGGNGGSGYVLTSESSKPVGYMLGEEYYLTDTILTSGGNNLPYAHTQIMIEVIEYNTVFFLCHDTDGYKSFNSENNKWEFLSTDEPTVEMIETLGSVTFETDAGLLPFYDIIFLDPHDLVDDISMNVTPNEQHVKTTVTTDMYVSRIENDSMYNDDDFVLDISVTRNNNMNITVDMCFDKTNLNTEDMVKIYSVQLYNK